MEDPDEEMMREVERTLEITGRAEDFRQGLIAKIGAWSLDHRGQKPVLAEIFADLLRKLRDAYFEQHKKTIAKGIGELVQLLTGNEGHLVAEARTPGRDRAGDADRQATGTRGSRRAIWSARSPRMRYRSGRDGPSELARRRRGRPYPRRRATAVRAIAAAMHAVSAVAGRCAAAEPRMLKGPYLQDLAPTSITVMWQLDEPQPARS